MPQLLGRDASCCETERPSSQEKEYDMSMSKPMAASEAETASA